jgi:hypothetical protein
MKVPGRLRHLGPIAAAVVAASTAIVGLEVAPAAAAASISVTPSTAAPGGTVVISGSIPTTGTQSCVAGDAPTITSVAALFPPDGFGPQAPRGTSGDFHVSYTIPSSTPAGSYTLGARCGGGNVGVSTTLTVLTGAPGAGLGGASRAGGDSAPWIAGGLAAGAAGAGIALAAARRRASPRQ